MNLKQKISKIFFIFILSFIYSYDTQALEECVDFKINNDRGLYYSGENLFLNIDIKIDEGFHIYSVHPEKSLSATYVEIIDSLVFDKIGIMHEPKPKKKFDNSFNQYVHYHTGRVNLVQDIKIKEDVGEGNYAIHGYLNYLACDPSMCIPKSDEFIVNLIINNGDPREECSKELSVEDEKSESK